LGKLLETVLTLDSGERGPSHMQGRSCWQQHAGDVTDWFIICDDVKPTHVIVNVMMSLPPAVLQDVSVPMT